MLEESRYLSKNQVDDDRLLSLRDVRKSVGLSSATIYRRMNASAFPRPLVLSPGCVRWKESDLVAWKKNLPQKPLPPKHGCVK
jgi:prophage regulatory protein